MFKESIIVESKEDEFKLSLEERYAGLKWIFINLFQSTLMLILSFAIAKSFLIGYIGYLLYSSGDMLIKATHIGEMSLKQIIIAKLIAYSLIIIGLGILLIRMIYLKM